MVFYLIAIFWFFRQAKSILFWIYLWQLKEYHIGRFIDYFRTEKGKKIFKNNLYFLKIALALILFTPIVFFGKSLFVFWVLLLVYFLEAVKFLYDCYFKKLLKPVFTFKTLCLTVASFIFIFFYLIVFFQLSYGLISLLLLFDILTPLIISGFVLLFQPLAVLMRNQVLKKAREKRLKFKDLLAVGITGSYGKSSAKEFLAQILSAKFKVLKTRGNQNSEIGLANCILQELKPDHQIFVVEMGAYNRGGIKLLCSIARPKIGILTGINEQHASTFGSLDNIIKAKLELIESLPADGTAILNQDNEIIKKLKPDIRNYNSRLGQFLFVSTKEKANIWAEEIEVYKNSISFKVFSSDGTSALFKLNLLGVQNIENILLAIACAKELGMTLEEINTAVLKIIPFKNSPRLLRGIKDFNIIDSGYSANPAGTLSHIDHLKLWPGKKIIVMPCLIELGQFSSEVHQKIGQKIGSICDLAIVTKKECFLDIKNSALKSGLKQENIVFLEKITDIADKIKQCSVKDSVVLLEGRLPSGLKKMLLKNSYGDKRN